MGIWESEYHINSNLEPASSIWYFRPWHPTSHMPWPLGNPGHSTQLVQKLSLTMILQLAVDCKYSSLGNSGMEYLRGHVLVPICWHATAHILRIKLTTPLHLLHLLMTTPYITTSKQATNTRTQNQNRPGRSIHTIKTLDRYNAPEAKPWKNWIHTSLPPSSCSRRHHQNYSMPLVTLLQ